MQQLRRFRNRKGFTSMNCLATCSHDRTVRTRLVFFFFFFFFFFLACLLFLSCNVSLLSAHALTSPALCACGQIVDLVTGAEGSLHDAFVLEQSKLTARIPPGYFGLFDSAGPLRAFRSASAYSCLLLFKAVTCLNHFHTFMIPAGLLAQRVQMANPS